MLGQNEIEQVIRLINKGFSLELLALELDISLPEVQACAKQLELRKFAKQSIKAGQISEAIEKLSEFVASSEHNIVERTIILKLQAYTTGESIDEELKKIEEERKRTGFSKNIDELLEKLGVQIPKKKNSNIRKKMQSEETELDKSQEKDASADYGQGTEPTTIHSYEQAIMRYKDEIAKDPRKSLNKRNLLAFAYLKSGRIDEARDELISLIDEQGSYMAYRQLIYLEKSQGNFQDARLWADACLEQFPNNLDVRHQLVSVAIEEGDNREAIKQLRKIISMSPENRKGKTMLDVLSGQNER